MSYSDALREFRQWVETMGYAIVKRHAFRVDELFAAFDLYHLAKTCEERGDTENAARYMRAAAVKITEVAI